MDIHEYTLWEVGYSGSLQDIANILEYHQEQVLFSGVIHATFVIIHHIQKTVKRNSIPTNNTINMVSLKLLFFKYK